MGVLKPRPEIFSKNFYKLGLIKLWIKNYKLSKTFLILCQNVPVNWRLTSKLKL